MAAVDVTFTGVLYDKVARTSQNVVMIGEASLTGFGIGGGPIIPPVQPPGQGGIPTHPIALPGDPWWGGDLKPTHPIMLPGMPGWPSDPPPEIPPPGSPPQVVGPVSPVNPIVPPPAIIVNYPGVGKVLVPLPAPPPEK